MLTAGGLAPCLSSAVAELISGYSRIDPTIEMIGYLGGYAGLLQGRSLPVTAVVRERVHVLHGHGGSPLGNSRVKLSNVTDCVRRGLVKEGEVPLEVAAGQLARDGITILHTIGGDDTSTTAAELASHLAATGHRLTVVGLPKTVDNDIVPVAQSMGALTAAEQGAIFFENFGNEHSAAPRTLLVHEVMGRLSGWLTAQTARAYRERLAARAFLPEFNLTRAHMDIDAVYVPEAPFEIAAEAERLAEVMARKDSVAIFVSEGANAENIVAEIIAGGGRVERDAFGHVALDKINVGARLGEMLGPRIGAERVLVQKSGYFARSAAANGKDRELIAAMARVAIDSALDGVSGLVGHDLERGGELRAIELSRVRGGKPFDPEVDWFRQMLATIGQH
ncbi:MAG: pyrophosphate--fructose 6-phosphate 1-phosphotransferase [Alphaproteobacteria bacterium]|nr:MAG: pyrophosphate--fructose 6-phosphate 1-phosphotransferase [Alphaproteobacteria bacterium]